MQLLPSTKMLPQYYSPQCEKSINDYLHRPTQPNLARLLAYRYQTSYQVIKQEQAKPFPKPQYRKSNKNGNHEALVLPASSDHESTNKTAQTIACGYNTNRPNARGHNPAKRADPAAPRPNKIARNVASPPTREGRKLLALPSLLHGTAGGGSSPWFGGGGAAAAAAAGAAAAARARGRRG
jgi:hypothetical protein